MKKIRITPPIIDRDYYEDLIAKVILFREMEELYGTRTKAIGQIRAAVIPYFLSVIYINTDLKEINLICQESGRMKV